MLRRVASLGVARFLSKLMTLTPAHQTNPLARIVVERARPGMGSRDPLGAPKASVARVAVARELMMTGVLKVDRNACGNAAEVVLTGL